MIDIPKPPPSFREEGLVKLQNSSKPKAQAMAVVLEHDLDKKMGEIMTAGTAAGSPANDMARAILATAISNYFSCIPKTMSLADKMQTSAAIIGVIRDTAIDIAEIAMLRHIKKGDADKKD